MTITELDLQVLFYITKRMTMEEMAEKTGKGVSAVQYRVNHLIKEGCVSRPAERKARSLFITPQGLAVLEQYGVKLA
jgi:predicted transcriptional regulator